MSAPSYPRKNPTPGARFIGLALAAACLLATASAARAQDADYEGIIRSAIAEYQAGRYEEATALFLRAHAMQPSARTHRGLGLAYFEARRYSLAVVHLRAAAADQRRPLTAEQRQHALQVLSDAQQFVARVRLRVEPSDASITVDGNPADRDGEFVLLDAGRHELGASSPGYASDRRALDARASETIELHIALVRAGGGNAQGDAASSDEGRAAAEAGAQTERGGGGVGVGPFIVLGAGAALVAGAGITWLLANDAHDELQTACPDRECQSASFQDDVDRGEALVTATNVLLIAGAVGLAAGGTYFVLQAQSGDDGGGPALSAACTNRGCNAALRGAF